jgi:hypothetical protein
MSIYIKNENTLGLLLNSWNYFIQFNGMAYNPPITCISKTIIKAGGSVN